MKKLLILTVIVLAFALAFTSCGLFDGGKDSNQGGNNGNETENGGSTENGDNTEDGGNTESGNNENDINNEAPNYSQGLKFTSMGDGTCFVSGIGTCTDHDIVIPPTSPNGDRVTVIGGAAFRMCHTITSIVIPDSVTGIGASAFAYCKFLRSVVIPDSVTGIREEAFAYCSNLVSVVVPDRVANIGYNAFYDCMRLTTIVIGKGVTSIGNCAFDRSYADIFYNGDEDSWGQIEIGYENEGLQSSTIYFYSEGQPTLDGDFWHYVDEVPTAWQ